MSTGLLTRDEAPPFLVRNAGARAPFVLIGDHAGCDVPVALTGLGLPVAELTRHIGWDIGVAALGARLADLTGACFISQRVSRLVIDCNRDPGRQDAICEISDGTRIAANVGLALEDRRARVAEIFAPYHQRIAEELDARAAQGDAPLLIALHSFTPVLGDVSRPWRYGVLHLGGSAASASMLAALRRRMDPDFVGDNQPYEMNGTDFTIPHHAVARGIDYLELEVRQDLLSEDFVTVAAELLYACLLEVVAHAGRG